jgi:hypothetical protein
MAVFLKLLLETSPACLEGEALSLNEEGAPPVFRIFHSSAEKAERRHTWLHLRGRDQAARSSRLARFANQRSQASSISRSSVAVGIWQEDASPQRCSATQASAEACAFATADARNSSRDSDWALEEAEVVMMEMFLGLLRGAFGSD